MKVALIGGTSIAHSALFTGWEPKTVETKYGAVSLKTRGDQAVLNRHGDGETPLPPHRLNHRANIAALAAEGFLDVVSFNSVGSLRPRLAPGVFVSCADYVDLQVGPATFWDDEIRGGTPGIANNLLARIVRGCAPEFVIATGQTYVRTRGPRFETKAEIRVIRHWGDVVGMTLAHEADLCTEAGVRCTSLGVVDNYANGIENASLDLMKFNRLVHEHQARVDRFIARVLEVVS